MLVKLDHFPRVRGEHKKIFELPPTNLLTVDGIKSCTTWWVVYPIISKVLSTSQVVLAGFRPSTVFSGEFSAAPSWRLDPGSIHFHRKIRWGSHEKISNVPSSTSPYHPCMVYFPTLVDFYGKCREIYHTWMVWAGFAIITKGLDMETWWSMFFLSDHQQTFSHNHP